MICYNLQFVIILLPVLGARPSFSSTNSGLENLRNLHLLKHLGVIPQFAPFSGHLILHIN